MEQADARAFVMALNNIQGYVPPMFFSQLVNNPIIRIIEGVGNGQMVANITPVNTGKPTVIPGGKVDQEKTS